MRLLKRFSKFISFIVIISNLAGHEAKAASIHTRMVRVHPNLSLRMGIMSSNWPKPVGDVIYLHGFGDRLDHHEPLFRTLSDQGYRVISFDWPSHGETQSNSIDWYTLDEMAELVKFVERSSREEQTRPLFVVGWSAGGLLAVRMAQKGQFQSWGREPKAMVLHTPGVALRMIPGSWGLITEDSLTSNALVPHRHSPQPASPYLKPLFSLRLLLNSIYSFHEVWPSKIPMLTILAGEELDRYAHTGHIKGWVQAQRSVNAALKPSLPGLFCPQAKHEIDNEVEPIGATVRLHTVSFLNAVLRDHLPEYFALPQGGICIPF